MTPDWVWTELRECAENNWPAVISTTLLGRVYVYEKPDGTWVGFIPKWLEEVARTHGLEVTAADYERGTYGLRLIQTPSLIATTRLIRR